MKVTIGFRARTELRRKTAERPAVSLANPLDGMIARFLDIKPALRAGVEALRAVVVGELQRQEWWPPGGGRRPWPARHAFGRRLPDAQALGADYHAAWAGGAGSVEVVTETQAAFGVLGSRFPHAKYHRGGTGDLRVGDVAGKGNLVSDLAQVNPWKRTRGTRYTQSPQKWAIFWKLGLTYGVWISRRKLAEGLFTPFRPHATRNPESVTRMTAIMSAHATGRQIPRFV